MKALNKLKHFVSHSKVSILMVHLDVRNYILQGELGEGRFRWIAKINQYNVQVRITEVNKCIGL